MEGPWPSPASVPSCSPSKEKKTYISHHVCSPSSHLEVKAGTGGASPAAPGEHVPEDEAGGSVTMVLFPHPWSQVELPRQPCPLPLMSLEPTLTQTEQGLPDESTERFTPDPHRGREAPTCTERTRKGCKPLRSPSLKQISRCTPSHLAF